MQARTRVKTGKPESAFDRVLEAELLSYTRELASILNKGLGFTDNWNGQAVTFTSHVTPDTEDSVAHSLGRVPTGFLILNRDKAGIVYQSGTAWTTSAIFVKTSVASMTTTILVF